LPPRGRRGGSRPRASAGTAPLIGSVLAASLALFAPCSATAHPPRYEHVITIVLENHSYADVVGSSPYLNRLAGECGLAATYFAVAHPSLPNYLALTSGSAGGISSACTDCAIDVPSIFRQGGGDLRAHVACPTAHGL